MNQSTNHSIQILDLSYTVFYHFLQGDFKQWLLLGESLGVSMFETELFSFKRT